MILRKRSKIQNWKSWRSKSLALPRGEVEVLLLDECPGDGDGTLSVVEVMGGTCMYQVTTLISFLLSRLFPLSLSKALLVCNYLIVIVVTDRLLQPGTLDLRICAGWPLSIYKGRRRCNISKATYYSTNYYHLNEKS